MEKLVELVFVLDMSGSMSGLESDTIGGYNSILKKQKEEGSVRVTTTLFNSNMKMIHDGKDIKDVNPLTNDDYIPGGCTALLDAIGNTISHVTAKQSALKEEDRPTKTLMVITTDGLENSSVEFSKKAVKALIESKEAAGWEFLFVGANIDVIETGESFGISRDHSVDYICDKKGNRVMFCALNETISNTRMTGKVSRKWKEKINEDYEGRK